MQVLGYLGWGRTLGSIWWRTGWEGGAVEGREGEGKKKELGVWDGKEGGLADMAGCPRVQLIPAE